MSNGKFARVLQSMRDGSLPFRICNRFSRVQYAPVTELTTTQIIAREYPGDGWKKLSPGARSTWNKFHSALEHKPVRRVVWVGANDGSAALQMNEAFPGMEFYLLEPVRAVFEILQRNIQPHPNLHGFNLAAGAVACEREMFVDKFSPASSLLPYDRDAAKAYPFLGEQRKETVRVRPLDELFAEWKLERADFLVLDVQGYEDAVLAGARSALPRVQLVLTEMNLKQLYVGTATFDSVYRVLTQVGFQLKQITHVHRNVNNDIVQIDGLFCRD